MQQHNIQLNPLAIIAGLLFNFGEVDKVMVKPDDQDEKIEVNLAAVSIEKEGDSLMAIIPLERVMQFNTTPYNFNMKIDNGLLTLTLDKAETTLSLLTANGTPQNPQPSANLRKLMERMK